MAEMATIAGVLDEMPDDIDDAIASDIVEAALEMVEEMNME